MRKLVLALLFMMGFAFLAYPLMEDYLLEKKQLHMMVEEEAPKETSKLDLTEVSMLAELYVPKIDLRLPIFDGTDEASLSQGAGRVESTSLIGAPAPSNAVLSSHSGLSVNRLFTKIGDLSEGDVFYLKMKQSIPGSTVEKDDILQYRVYRKETVLPTELKALQPVEGKETVSLMTCTPLFINSHRLFVYGERVAYDNSFAPAQFSPLAFLKRNRLWLGGLFLYLLFAIILIVRYPHTST